MADSTDSQMAMMKTLLSKLSPQEINQLLAQKGVSAPSLATTPPAPADDVPVSVAPSDSLSEPGNPPTTPSIHQEGSQGDVDMEEEGVEDQEKEGELQKSKTASNPLEAEMEGKGGKGKEKETDKGVEEEDVGGEDVGGEEGEVLDLMDVEQSEEDPEERGRRLKREKKGDAEQDWEEEVDGDGESDDDEEEDEDDPDSQDRVAAKTAELDQALLDAAFEAQDKAKRAALAKLKSDRSHLKDKRAEEKIHRASGMDIGED
jgi:hypothetical protein